MATTTSPHYSSFPASGLYPPDTFRQAMIYEDDESGLDSNGDIVKYIPIAIGCAITDCGMELGDFDTGTAITNSLIINNGTEYEVVKDVTIARAGGVSRMGDGTSPELTPVGVTQAALSYVGVKTTAAPTGAQSSGRKVVVWADVHART